MSRLLCNSADVNVEVENLLGALKMEGIWSAHAELPCAGDVVGGVSGADPYARDARESGRPLVSVCTDTREFQSCN